ncbi:hypothetical protein LN042_18760 [Kitasatospora sp. RB6PN24]|uniref:hypothetical protein n=1 Tax=Kitasatospora humi TaxID=2893891 RepID=UPI001E2C31D3|nr:hypothetical protein [Kitasatospora humi]MCC9309098.1 hypothetical protein [Kitasatospora humi]
MPGQQPTTLTDDVEDDEDETTAEVADPATGEVRVLADLCTTCIFRPGNLMRLQPGRVRHMVRAALAAGGHIPCHSTLPGVAPAGTKAAICRGFANAYGRQILALRIGAALGTILEVEPPEVPHLHASAPDPTCPQ